MDQATKLELAKATVPSIVMPLMRAGASHHFRMKELSKREELELQKVETKARAAQQLGGRSRPQTPGSEVAGEPEPQTGGRDVYDELARIRDESTCEFCTTAASKLMEAEREQAQRGRDELVEYLRLTKEMEGRELTQEEAEAEVRDLAQAWEILPQAVSGGL